MKLQALRNVKEWEMNFFLTQMIHDWNLKNASLFLTRHYCHRFTADIQNMYSSIVHIAIKLPIGFVILAISIEAN